MIDFVVVIGWDIIKPLDSNGYVEVDDLLLNAKIKTLNQDVNGNIGISINNPLDANGNVKVDANMLYELISENVIFEKLTYLNFISTELVNTIGWPSTLPFWL